MKRSFKILWIIIGCLFVGGVITGVVGFAMVDFQPERIEGEETSLKNYDVKMDPAKTKEIIVDVSCKHVCVQFTESNTFSIVYDENRKYPLTIREEEPVLELTQAKKQNWYDFLTLWPHHETVNLLVPNTFTGILNIKTENGGIQVMDGKSLKKMKKLECRTKNATISLSDLQNIEALDCETSNSKIEMRYVAVSSDVHLKTTNGALHVENANVQGLLEGETSNGKLSVRSVEAKNCSLETANASLTLEDLNVSQALTAKTSNGSLSLQHLAGEEIVLRSSNGKISGTIAGKQEDYRIESHTSNATNSLPENKATGTKLLKAETSNGDINVTFTA
ncbi:MAG: DUF4097 family beta strand repeat-containing protein [Oscillospiraceae bacterium]|nr:DUF4097 family beta strand repeat-containing protein [Oscillospiraceae bacterium]